MKVMWGCGALIVVALIVAFTADARILLFIIPCALMMGAMMWMMMGGMGGGTRDDDQKRTGERHGSQDARE
ncbi:MAG: hypothetical protein M3063_07675 [Actinomycetota bacterium]|nr:hypothetical protein [Actinomycetota bacterium]